MSGKYRICSAAVVSLVLILSVFSVQAMYSESRHARDLETGEGQNGVKKGLRVNGYLFTTLGPKEIKGLREKAIADYYFNLGRPADVIRHYELASKYLPDEADIFYRLGSVYYSLSIYNTAARYYNIAAQKFLLPENGGKTQLNRYRSRIFEGMSLEKSRDIEGNHDKARSILAELQKEEKTIREDYPDATNALQGLYDAVFGQTRAGEMFK